MSDRQRISLYQLSDFVFSLLAWNCFCGFRYNLLGAETGFGSLHAFLFHSKNLAFDVAIPTFWVLLSALSGYYRQPRRKKIGEDLLNGFILSSVATLVIFFGVIINDLPQNYKQYYVLFLALFTQLLLFTALPRCILTAIKNRQHELRKTGIVTLVIGCGSKARELLDCYNRHRLNGYDLIEGCVRLEEEESPQVSQEVILGNLQQLDRLIGERGVEHLVIAADHLDGPSLQQLLDRLYGYGLDIHLYKGISAGLGMEMSMDGVSGLPLQRLTPKGMFAFEENVKRVCDLLIASLGLVVLSPLLLFLSLRVKCDSPGPVFFTQERLGKGRKPFRIIKFRTMYTDAEAQGPQLSSVNDRRITPYGAIMRRYRLDELPQLLNVIKGEMSLVGPRPERPYFAAKILERAPYYSLVYRVKPGITSLGMAKFGYADNVDKMIERLDYDIIYLKQASLLMDLKILVFTIKPLVRGSGV